MSWESQNGRGRYYTRSRRVNGKIIREYIGRGHLAEYASATDQIHQRKLNEDRKQWDDQRAKIEESDDAVETLCQTTNELIRAYLLKLGLRKYAGKWRFARLHEMPFEYGQTEAEDQDLATLIKLVEEENCGRALFTIRQRLSRSSIWQLADRQAEHALRATIATATQQNPALGARIDGRLAELRRDLVGPEPSRLETVLVERVGVAWLTVIIAESYRRGNDLAKREKYFKARVSEARRRHQLAIRLLEIVKKRTRLDMAKTGHLSIPESSSVPQETFAVDRRPIHEENGDLASRELQQFDDFSIDLEAHMYYVEDAHVEHDLIRGCRQIYALLRQAEAQNAGAIDELRAIAIREPDAVEAARQIMLREQEIGIDLISQVNPDLATSVLLKVPSIREALTDTFPLEKLLAERVLTRWIDVLHHMYLNEATAEAPTDQRRYFVNRLDEARKKLALANKLRKRVCGRGALLPNVRNWPRATIPRQQTLTQPVPIPLSQW